MRGPNYWSVRRHKLIQMRLDLEELEQSPTNKIDGFSERLEKMLPSMFSHRCSEKVAGGFFLRVKNGTWMGHVIEHIALEIQTLAGMETGFGRTRSTSKEGVYNVVFVADIVVLTVELPVVRVVELANIPIDVALIVPSNS